MTLASIAGRGCRNTAVQYTQAATQTSLAEASTGKERQQRNNDRRLLAACGEPAVSSQKRRKVLHCLVLTHHARQCALRKCFRCWCPARSSKPLSGASCVSLVGSIPMHFRLYPKRVVALARGTWRNFVRYNGLRLGGSFITRLPAHSRLHPLRLILRRKCAVFCAAFFVGLNGPLEVLIRDL